MLAWSPDLDFGLITRLYAHTHTHTHTHTRTHAHTHTHEHSPSSMNLLSSIILSYEEDSTSPALCDPYNPEDYTYSILSKSLTKPVNLKSEGTSATPSLS